jgi:hypothetical protein
MRSTIHFIFMAHNVTFGDDWCSVSNVLAFMLYELPCIFN